MLDRGLVQPGEDSRRSIWEDRGRSGWERDLIALFVNNQIRVFAAMPVLALLCAIAGLQWTTPVHAAAWFLSAVTCAAIQHRLCRAYLADSGAARHASEWIGLFCASEFLGAVCWSLPLFVYWDRANDFQHIFLIASLMAVVAVRILIAANFMPVIIAGTGFLTFNIAMKCLTAADPLYLSLGAMAVLLELFFIHLSLHLAQTARDMLIFKAQREGLIAELKSEREQADSARLKAEDANKAKTQFLATMSHELRTPLNAILGFSEILSNEMFGKHGVGAYKVYAGDIHSSGSHLLALVNDILDIARIEAGRKELNEEPLDPETVLDDMAHTIELRTKQKRQAVKLQPRLGLPKLYADRRAVNQILLNLLTNAVKFTPEGGTITLAAYTGADGRLSFSVKDDGPGVPEAELGQIMEAFHRGSYARTKAIDGAGLGLSIVKGLAGLHHAQFELRSAPGKGTEAVVTFPLERVLSGPRIAKPQAA